jgi:uncharacterized protein DUF4386
MQIVLEMMTNISNKQRASLVGVLILVAYSMLTYSITKNNTLGIITDIVSGFAVIGIPLLMFPIFNSKENKVLYYGYLISRFIEGILMIIGGILILNPSLECYRNMIYESIHIYFFIVGALFFYILFYRTSAIPKFISVWGILATIILFVITIIKLLGINLTILNALLIPMILNELFLAFWLIVKGFNVETIEKRQ